MERARDCWDLAIRRSTGRQGLGRLLQNYRASIQAGPAIAVRFRTAIGGNPFCFLKSNILQWIQESKKLQHKNENCKTPLAQRFHSACTALAQRLHSICAARA